ncbi:MAG: TlpA disulfide reductase family protein [Parasutterella sp.]
MKKFLALTVLAGAVLFSPAPQAADFDRVYETGTPLKAPRAMPNFRELKHALKMPQFDLKTIYGKNVNLADYKGKVVVLNVWATWCRPCVAEIPELITAQNALKNSDVRVIGVAVDGGNVDLKSFSTRSGLPVLKPSSTVNRRFPGKWVSRWFRPTSLLTGTAT